MSAGLSGKQYQLLIAVLIVAIVALAVIVLLRMQMGDRADTPQEAAFVPPTEPSAPAEAASAEQVAGQLATRARIAVGRHAVPVNNPRDPNRRAEHDNAQQGGKDGEVHPDNLACERYATKERDQR